MSKPDLMCETTCKFFKCSERYLKITHKGNQKLILCRMVEGDDCVGHKCKFALCFHRPSALDISTGRCNLKVKEYTSKTQVKKHQQRTKFSDDPLKYQNYLDKKLKKQFSNKDFF